MNLSNTYHKGDFFWFFSLYHYRNSFSFGKPRLLAPVKVIVDSVHANEVEFIFSSYPIQGEVICLGRAELSRYIHNTREAAITAVEKEVWDEWADVYAKLTSLEDETCELSRIK